MNAMGPQPDKMGASMLEPTNIVTPRCSLFYSPTSPSVFEEVSVCLSLHNLGG